MQVIINQGKYRGKEVHNQEFEMVTPVRSGKKGYFITVRPNADIGGDKDKIRVTVNPGDLIFPDGEMGPAVEDAVRKAIKVETDQEVMDRIADRFAILEEMTAASIEGKVRGMIVVGPPGVGKSYGVIKQLEKAHLFDQVAQRAPQFDIVKGAMTSLGLYIKLYDNKNPNMVIVFDDCDSILMDDLSLNLLKAALDSGKKRKICWNADSHALKNAGIPSSFDFNGSVIFITNIQFDHIRSKKLQDHLKALQSRCHYLDLTMNTMRDCVLRIQQIHNTGELFSHYFFTGNEGNEIVEYMIENKERLREVSLRMAVKIADLVQVTPTKWKRLAESTVMKNSF
jgi:hypothetical protein